MLSHGETEKKLPITAMVTEVPQKYSLMKCIETVAINGIEGYKFERLIFFETNRTPSVGSFRTILKYTVYTQLLSARLERSNRNPLKSFQVEESSMPCRKRKAYLVCYVNVNGMHMLYPDLFLAPCNPNASISGNVLKKIRIAL